MQANSRATKAMDDAVRQILKRLVELKGKDTMLDARRCEGLLRDYCPSSKREIGALVRSLKRQCPQRLMKVGSSDCSRASISSQVLAENDDVSASEGTWAAEAWAFALAVPFTPPVKNPGPIVTLANGTPSVNTRQTGSATGPHAGTSAGSQSQIKTGSDKSVAF